VSARLDSPVPGVDEQVIVATAAQMRGLGRRLAGLLHAGDLVVLSGPLGAGKTTLAQGIGAGLGVRGQITSPTFVIARVHPNLGAGPDLVHADAYRLGSQAEVDDLDLDADLATSVTVVEWGEGLVEKLAASFLSVGIRAEADGAPDYADPADGDPAGDLGDTDLANTDLGDTDLANTDPGSAETGDDLDMSRTVHVQGFGERWRQPAAAAAAREAVTSAT
jgi:tRNA threonylcarbamoyladenosine biosynthesis protein TsaE